MTDTIAAISTAVGEAGIGIVRMSGVNSIEIGKDADIVIWDNNPLEIQSNVLYTIIDGKIVYKK